MAQEKEPSDEKVAVVNGTVITRSELDKEVGRLQRQLVRMRQPATASTRSELERDALGNLVDFELLYEEGRKKGVKVDEAALDERMNAMRKRFATEAEYKEALSGMNLSEAVMRSQFERGMTIEQFVDEHFVQNVTVSDDESKAYYDANPDSFKRPEQVQASHILIKVDPQADESQKAEARRKLEDIRQKVLEGGDFAALATESSECPSSAAGGDLGYFRRGQMVKPFEDTAFALNPGETSDIVETRFGYHLIRLTDRKPETLVPYEEVKDNIGLYLKQKKVQEAVRSYLGKLKEEAEVELFLPEAQE
jgi:peptidyl-prolyl cis-trans isomerase C